LSCFPVAIVPLSLLILLRSVMKQPVNCRNRLRPVPRRAPRGGGLRYRRVSQHPQQEIKRQ
jgi:hypothetical protein